MHLTKWVAVIMAALLSSCANQSTIIPQGGQEMKDIYRNALNESDDAEAPYYEEAALFCESVQLNESIESCQHKAEEILKDTRLVISANPNEEELDYLPYTRTQVNEIESLFPRLPNPDLLIYVYPHLATRNRAPIPGYTSSIPLYERVQYKLPGETHSATF